MPGQILLTEAVCCILFGSFDTWEYREIRPSSLPPVNWAGGLNRSDPLRIPGMSNQVGTDVTTYRRLKRLQNCLDFGLTRVVPYTKNYGSTSWRFSCFNERLTIPVEVVMEWGLNDGKPFEVNVRWEVANDTHQHAFAAMAEESDDGRRVGIQVSKNIRNHWVHHWIVRNIPSAVPLANTLHDFLTGKIVEKNYTWLPSRKYIFGTAHRKSGVDGEVEKANTPKGNNALELTYRGSFIWSDPKRLVETKPGNMMAKDLDCSKAMVAVDVEQNDAAGTSEGCNRCYEHEYDECDWCDECGPTAKVDNWLQELLDEHHQLLRQQGCLTYTGGNLDDYPLQDSDDNI